MKRITLYNQNDNAILMLDVFDKKRWTMKVISYPGDLLKLKLYMDVPSWTSEIDSLFQFFCSITHQSVYYFDRKAPNFAQIGCFLQ